MSGQHLLVPLDVRHGKTDTLLYLQCLAAQSPIYATLLYVMELNIDQPEPDLCRELCAEGEMVLRKLARRFLGHEETARLCVRAGCPAAQILAEARICHPDLILLSSPQPRSWLRPFRSHTVERVVQAAPCPTLVLPLCWPIIPSASQTQPSARATSASPAPRLRPTWAVA